MKLLMIHTTRFAYSPNLKSLEEAEVVNEDAEYLNALVGFIHVEEKDMENAKHIENNLVKNLKWGARKNNADTIVVHSFAHLSESKADPEFSKEFLEKVKQRLVNAGWHAVQTPWGYFLNLELNAPGESLARVFKSF
jgi:spermidine synthase